MNNMCRNASLAPPAAENGVSATGTRAVLVIDDNVAIHADIRKVLAPDTPGAAALAESEAALFGSAPRACSAPVYVISCATQGQEGVELARRARQAGAPFELAFVDARMPPGWDGLETIEKLWEADPAIQVVLCTAYADYTWQQIRARLRHPDRLVILKKPFDNIEVQQLAEGLTEKWRMAREAARSQSSEPLAVAVAGAGAGAQSATPVAVVAAPILDVTANLDDPEIRRRVLEQELRLALRREQLSMHYQPLVDIATLRVVGVEALMRWWHPELGAVSPGEFIPIAESSGLIRSIGEFALRTACSQIVRWEREGIRAVPVAVNVSSIQLECESIADWAPRIFREARLPPERLALEITESALLRDAQQHVNSLQQLRDQGVRIEIDDFGTGYSSLSYLKQLPVDALKIDRSFVSQMDTNPVSEAIVAAILALARGLGIKVIAEGVENARQLKLLANHGCQTAQGFYFSRPLPADQCRALLIELERRTAFTDTLRLHPLLESRSQDAEDCSTDCGLLLQ